MQTAVPIAADAAPVVQLRNVTKAFGKQVAVSNLSFAVPRGSIYGFIGPNGSGKTTSIRMILHIFLPDRGEVEVLGTQSHRAANDQIGYLPEERGLYKKMKVLRLLTYYGALKGLPSGRAREAALAWLERVGLGGCAEKRIEALSKGMAQKVQFISAVIAQPKLVILDEPFSGLDPLNLEVLRSAILDLRKQGTTVIFSTHDMSMAEKMCDFILMICRGKKVLDGTLEQIQAAHGRNLIRVRWSGGAEGLTHIPGVSLWRDHGSVQEVNYDGDPQQLLRRLSEGTSVQLFEIVRPSLHDIFLQIAGDGEKEAVAA